MTAIRLALTLVAAFALTGCSGTTLKSPIKILHDARLGNYQVFEKEYRGSDRARDWHLREQAMEMQAQMTAESPGAASL